MKLFQKKNNKGFSLVELIVVVAIMAVLMGILIPTLITNVEKSKVAKDEKQISEVVNAMNIAMASEKYSGVSIATDDYSFSNGTLTLKIDGTNAGFIKEVISNLEAGVTTSYTVTLTSTEYTTSGKSDVSFSTSNSKATATMTKKDGSTTVTIK